jgi:DNA-binding winged helix-turn-helix (wHTH) protein
LGRRVSLGSQLCVLVRQKGRVEHTTFNQHRFNIVLTMHTNHTSVLPVYNIENISGQEFIFGSFRLVPRRRVIFRDGKPLRLGDRAREILVALVERAGETVTKRELIARVWPDAIVEEATLRAHIAFLRKALADSPVGARYVENINGQGYRFVAPVTRIDAGSDALANAD